MNASSTEYEENSTADVNLTVCGTSDPAGCVHKSVDDFNPNCGEIKWVISTDSPASGGDSGSSPVLVPTASSPTALPFDVTNFMEMFASGEFETDASVDGILKDAEHWTLSPTPSDESVRMATPDFRVAALEADCEELRDKLQCSDFTRQDLMVRLHGLEAEQAEQAATQAQRVASLEEKHEAAIKELEVDLVRCKMDLAEAKGASK